MQLRHIIVATDESDAGRQAIRTALALAARAGARVTVVRAVHVGPMMPAAPAPATTSDDGAGGAPALERLQRWVEADLPVLPEQPGISYAVAFGLPGIEIARFAEQEGADLIVLGRKPRSRMTRLLLGDTADAVARRSRVPCLFVPGTTGLPRRVIVAVDGTERGLTVLTTGDGFARAIGADLGVFTVERPRPEEPAILATATPAGRSTRIQERVRELVGREVELRRGEPAEQILATVEEQRPDVLVIGSHRGGPAGVIEAGSTARRVAHTAPCAVLTVPL
jgi:nucleotide-binding universal stress UspA family protein